MKSINDALLEDIIEHPDDDTPRLVYADRLEEEGGPAERARAEFIRNQIQIASLPKGDSRLPALRRREAELLNRYGKKWLAELGLGERSGQFVRGFLEGASLTGATYLKFAKRLASRTPLRTLRLEHLGPRIWRLAACPQLRSVTTLILAWPGMDDADAAVLAASSHVAGLKILDVRDNCLSAEGVEALLSSPHLQGGEVLFARNPLGQAAGTLLARNPALVRCTLLDLEGTRLGNEGLAALLQSPYLGNLVELRLRGCEIGDDGVRALVRARLPALCRLDLGGNELGNAELALLAGSLLLAQITHLDLGNNHVGNDGARALAGSAQAGRLQVLSLAHNHINRQGRQALRESKTLCADLSLCLKGNRLSAGAAHLFDDDDDEADEADEPNIDEDEDYFAPGYEHDRALVDPDWRTRLQPTWNRRAW
jgi:uncharacterized protein (TIGR02996 family)